MVREHNTVIEASLVLQGVEKRLISINIPLGKGGQLSCPRVCATVGTMHCFMEKVAGQRRAEAPKWPLEACAARRINRAGLR